MESLRLEILAQPTVSSCGPTCLHAVYRYWGDAVDLDTVVREVASLEGGGTLAVEMGRHALGRGYRATLHTLNLQVFDPTWFKEPRPDLRAKLRARHATRAEPKLRHEIEAYLDFLERGGTVHMQGFTPDLIRGLLRRGRPILAGLSSTWLYQDAREGGADGQADDDVGGDPSGHFVVLAGYEVESKQVQVADPYRPNPAGEHLYPVPIGHVIHAILLGILTYDANLLVVTPTDEDSSRRR